MLHEERRRFMFTQKSFVHCCHYLCLCEFSIIDKDRDERIKFAKLIDLPRESRCSLGFSEFTMVKKNLT